MSQIFYGINVKLLTNKTQVTANSNTGFHHDCQVIRCMKSDVGSVHTCSLFCCYDNYNIAGFTLVILEHFNVLFIRWFKFTLKPPYSGAHERSLLAIWDTSHWNFFVKFGLRTA